MDIVGGSREAAHTTSDVLDEISEIVEGSIEVIVEIL